MGAEPPQIVLVQGQPLARAGARHLLDGIVGTVVADARTLDEALALGRVVDVGRVHLVVADQHLPDADGAMVVASLVRAFPRARLLVVGAWDQPHDAHAAISAGAHGLFARDAPAADLQRAATELLEGGSSVPAELVAGILRSRGLGSPVEVDLSPRDEQLLLLIAQGLTNHQMAEQLGIVLRTVEKQRARLAHKLGAHGRADLVRIALERGLLH